MTRKDFELIAATLKASRDPHTAKANETIDYLSRQMADALKCTNAQFDADRFLRACGVAS